MDGKSSHPLFYSMARKMLHACCFYRQSACYVPIDDEFHSSVSDQLPDARFSLPRISGQCGSTDAAQLLTSHYNSSCRRTQHALIVFAEPPCFTRRVNQIRPLVLRGEERLLPAPPGNLCMIPSQQHGRH